MPFDQLSLHLSFGHVQQQTGVYHDILNQQRNYFWCSRPAAPGRPDWKIIQTQMEFKFRFKSKEGFG